LKRRKAIKIKKRRTKCSNVSGDREIPEKFTSHEFKETAVKINIVETKNIKKFWPLDLIYKFPHLH
jgi:hypothetical protein